MANVRSVPVEARQELAGGWQPSLLGTLDRRVDLSTGRRHELGAGAWVAAELADALTERYERHFVQVHAALYRDGHDSVAWHSDRIGRVVADPVVAIVSLGSPRRFLMRPKGGADARRSRVFAPHPGDLLVMGGTCQHTWEHHVPKCRHAGPRVSLMFRHPD